MELNGHTALVTGGTAGIGLACAPLLAKDGASVVVTGRDVQRGNSAAEALGGAARFISSLITGGVLHVDGGGSAL